VPERTSARQTLAARFRNVLILILLAATRVSGLLGHALEATVIAVIALFAVVLGFVQEFRAERALEALRLMAAPGERGQLGVGRLRRARARLEARAAARDVRRSAAQRTRSNGGLFTSVLEKSPHLPPVVQDSERTNRRSSAA
jgi:hypothetical protein